MALQNRVLPDGEIIATEARGSFTGNRGIIHDPKTKTLLRRRWTTKAWICCTLNFKGRRRQVMAPGTWTELFFLDEVTALASGHRPCYFCRRADAQRFATAFASGNGFAFVKAGEMDEILHRERLASGADKRLLEPDSLAQLPNGSIIEHAGHYYTLVCDRAWAWRLEGYGPSISRESLQSSRSSLITPPSICNALEAGYLPEYHRSLMSL